MSKAHTWRILVHGERRLLCRVAPTRVLHEIAKWRSNTDMRAEMELIRRANALQVLNQLGFWRRNFSQGCTWETKTRRTFPTLQGLAHTADILVEDVSSDDREVTFRWQKKGNQSKLRSTKMLQCLKHSITLQNECITNNCELRGRG